MDSSGKKYQAYYPYNAVGLCLYIVENNLVSKKGDGYECKTGYLYIDTSRSKCVSRGDCIKDEATVYEENKTCIKGYSCKDFGRYFYRGENEDECISAEECLDKGWHPYSSQG